MSKRSLRGLFWSFVGVTSLFAARTVLAQPSVYTENFESYGVPGEPPGWFDSSPGNPKNEAPGLFKVWTDPVNGGNRSFGHKGASDTYSHYRARTFAAADGFRFEGRMLRTKTKAHLGVTFLSDFPNTDEFYLLAQRNDNGTVRLEGRGTGSANGDTESGVTLDINTWYRFVVEVTREGAIQRIRAKVWKQSQSEPSAWQIDATDDHNVRTNGWIGVWGEGAGEKHWDDFNIRSTAASDTDAPVIQITESGNPLISGTAFNRAVTPVITVVDASPTTVVRTLDGAPFTSGSVVTAEGNHTLAVSATDAAGNVASQSVSFSIDVTAPVIVSIAPPSGTLTRVANVIVSGVVQGASAVTVAGHGATLAGTTFSYGPLALVEGQNAILLIATDAVGNVAQASITIERDSTPPALTILQPSSPLAATSPIEVSGTAVDPHLESVTVGGAPANISGADWVRTGFALVEGANTITVRAVDSVGNASEASRTITLDRSEPVITITEGGQPLANGRLFARSVFPVFTANDAGTPAAELLVEGRLDGQPFVSGGEVSAEGSHTLDVTARDAAGNVATRSVEFTIDTTPPEFLAIQPSDGSLLADASVTLEGQVRGATTLTVDGVTVPLVGESFSAGPFALADGERTFTLIATDAAGNSTTREHHLMRDATAPVLTILDPEDGAIVAADEIVVRGTVTDANLIGVTVAGNSAAVVTGEFLSAPVPLVSGPNGISVEARDRAGNVTARTLTVIRDSDAPLVRITEAGVDLVDGASFARAVVIVIEITDATTLTREITLDGAPFTSGATVSTEGQHQLSVNATDAAGNRTSRLITFTIDSTAPVFSDLAPAAGSVVSEAQVVLTGRVRGAVELRVDGQPVPILGESFTAGPYALAEGERRFVLVAVDGANNRTEIEHSIVRDATPPQITISQPAAGALLGSTSVNVLGTASDVRLSTVTVNGVRASLTSGGYVATQVTLSEGENTLVARATDSAGNSSEASRTVVRDTTPPTIAITDPAAGAVVPDANITLRGTVADEHLDRVEIAGRRAQVDGGTWSLSVPLAEGNNTIIAKAFDRVGLSTSTQVDVRRNSTAPEVEIEQPTEGARLRTETIEVRGRFEIRPNLTLTVNGVAAVLGEGAEAGRFVAPGVPLLEGENRLIARARDEQGNEGVHTQTVFRDTVAPTFVASDPPSGAPSVPLGYVFRLTFSEPLAEPASSAIRLETLAGTALSFTIERTDAVLTLRPAAPLPSATELRLVLTDALTDLAGNALAESQTLTFTTSDGTAPDAPVLDPLAAIVCANEVVVRGAAESGSRIEITGGAGAALGEADAAGRFEIPVALVPNTLHRLEVVAVDREGNRSTAGIAQLLNDCVAPFVSDSERSSDSFTIRFNEPIDPASIAAAVTLEGEAGAIVGSTTVAADARSAVFTTTAPAPQGRLRLAVSTAVRDRAGNALAFPYAKVFGEAGGASFVAGTVIDDATGRPLGGARVSIVATDGVALAEPLPEATTARDGRFQIAVSAGTHDLVIDRVGYTPNFRIVTTVAGGGTDVLDPRLTPAERSVEITGSPQTIQTIQTAGAANAARLVLPAGALPAGSRVALTAVWEQGLPALLPYGWSPRGSAWLDLGTATLGQPATLSLAVNAPNGANLVAATLDLSTLQWRALETSVAVANGRVAFEIPAGNKTSAFAVVEPDAGALAPSPAVTGEVLGSSPHSAVSGSPVISGELTFDPARVLPTQVSVATVDYVLASDAAGNQTPSGLPLTLHITEELMLLDGSTRREAPYEADLVLYRASATSTTAARSRFRLMPSESAQLLPIELGSEDVRLCEYGGETVRGDVLGPAGGSVGSDEGDRIDVPAGALTAPAAVSLTRRPASELPVALPPGVALVQLLRLDLSNAELRAPASLSTALTPPPAAGSRGVLLQATELLGRPILRPVAAIVATDSGWQTEAIDADDLAWRGVTTGGLYAFVRYTEAHGYLRGRALRVVGDPFVGAAIVGTTGTTGATGAGARALGWTQIADDLGRYVLPAPLGPVVATTEDRASGNSARGEAEIPSAEARVDLDLQLAIVAPQVLEITPADGVTGVPAGVQPTVRFSESIDPASLVDAIELRKIGSGEIADEIVAITVEPHGARLDVVPVSTLIPGATYELTVRATIRDLQGYQLTGASSSRFTTQRILVNEDVDLTKVLLIEPDAQGDAKVIGRPGAVPAGTLVTVERTTGTSLTVSVVAATDGSFDLLIPATVRDRLLLHVFLQGANELILELTPFRTADGRGAYVGAQAFRFGTIDGIVVAIEAGTFDVPTLVRVEPRALGNAPTPLPEGFQQVYGFDVSFGGQLSKKPVLVSVPAPAGSTPGTYLLAHPARTSKGLWWQVDDLVELRGGRLTTEEPTTPTTPTTPAPTTANATGGSLDGSEITELPARTVDPEGRRSFADPLASQADPNRAARRGPRQFLPGMFVPIGYRQTRFDIWRSDHDLGWMNLPLPIGGGIEFFSSSGLAISVDAALYRILGPLQKTAIPNRLGRPFTLEARDLATGYKLFEGTFNGPSDPNQPIELPPSTLGDTTPPLPIGGSPIAFHVLDLGQSSSGELGVGVRMEFQNGTLSITAEAGALESDVQVRLIGLDAESNVEVTGRTDASGGLSLSTAATAGKRYLLGLGARLGRTETLEIQWSEELPEEFPGVKLLDPSGNEVELNRVPGATRESVRLSPETGWRAGVRYKLHLDPSIADGVGNAWGKTFELEIETEESMVLGNYPLTEARDLARFGSMLFVAADNQGLVILDASDPKNLKSYIPGDVHFLFPFAAKVRGVAVDPHGRVLAAGGGDTSPGLLRIYDPLGIDRAGLAADPNNQELRKKVFKGSSLISNYVGGPFDLPTGTPRRTTILSNDDRDTWTIGEEDPPSGVEMTPANFPEGSVTGGDEVSFTFTGTGVEKLPVSLRNLTLGRFDRVDAEEGSGQFTITMSARRGDRMELLRNRESIAYVAITGSGIAIVDVNAFYNEDPSGTPGPAVISDALGIYTGVDDPSLRVCNEELPDGIGFRLSNLQSFFDEENPHSLVVAALMFQQGVAMFETDPGAVSQLNYLSDVCGEVEGSRALIGLTSVQHYPFDFDRDGKLEEDEERDYLVVGHLDAGILVFDVTNRENATLAARIRLPGNVAQIGVDRENRLLFAAGYDRGLYVVDFDALPSIELIDKDGDGEDDRLLETIDLPSSSTRAPVLLAPELGFAFAGGSDRGISAVAIHRPRVSALTKDLVKGGLRQVRGFAPFGVETAPENDEPNAPDLPGSFFIQAALPGSLGETIQLDVFGLGPALEPYDEVGDPDAIPRLPRARLEMDHAIELKRLAENAWEPGYQLYLSKEIAVLADYRAARKYPRTEKEEDVCTRCDLEEAGLPEDAAELLSGEFVGVRFPDTLASRLEEIYGRDRLEAAELAIPSVRWDLSPAVRQEPRQNPSYSRGDAAPGTLLHSGEMVMAGADLSVRGRGLDFSFVRTYRNQTIGGGPLGLGWDFSYRQRLRELPNRDVELFDGRGRRERFTRREGEDFTYEAPEGLFAELKRTEDGWTLLNAGKYLTRFDRYGRLTSIADPVKDDEETGNEMRFSYDGRSRLVRVLDPLERAYELAYDDKGRLESLTDFSDRKVQYTYDEGGRLTEVTLPEAEGVGPRKVVYDYDDAAGEIAVALARRDNLTKVTDPRGTSRYEYTYQAAGGEERPEIANQQKWGTGSISIDFDLEGHTAQVTDRRGNTSTYQHNAAGQLVRYEDPSGAAWSYDLDDQGRLTAMTEPLGRSTTYSYQGGEDRRSQGNVMSITETADGRGGNGSGNSRTTSFEYESRTNQPTRIVDPRGAVTEISRDAAGLPRSIVRAAGSSEASSSAIEYNAFGQPTRMTNPNGHVSRFEYFDEGESKGYLSMSMVDDGGLSLATHYETDPRGNVTMVMDPRGIQHHAKWNDADWLMERVEAATGGDGASALGYRTALHYDENGNVIEEMVPTGDAGAPSMIRREFGPLDELMMVAEPIGEGQGEAITHFEYDENLNPKMIVAPAGQTTMTVYDERNLPMETMLGMGTPDVVHLRSTFDAEGNRTVLVDGRGQSWTTHFDGFSRPMMSADPLGNQTHAAYDPAGNPLEVKAMDSSGAMLSMRHAEYDLLGRNTMVKDMLFGESVAAGEVMYRSVYDGVGNVIQQIDPLGRTQSFEYDGAERMMKTVDPLGNRAEITLDATGNPMHKVVHQKTEAGGEVMVEERMSYDALGRELSRSDGLGNTWQQIYDARGNVRFSIDPEGHATEARYDALDRMLETIRPGGIALKLAYDPSGRLMSQTDALGHAVHYAYDALNRQISMRYPDGGTATYGYDGAGNRTSMVDPNGTRTTEVYDGAGRRISRAWQTAAGVGGPVLETFDYDGLSRLVAAQSGGAATSFSYDSLSRKTAESTNGRRLDYVRDLVGNPTMVTYPSGVRIGRVFDSLDRARSIGLVPTGNAAPLKDSLVPLASYSFQGTNLVAGANYSNGLSMSRTFDAANRQLSNVIQSTLGPVLSESLSWSPRNLKTATSRGEANGRSQVFAYDEAGRLTQAARTAAPRPANNTVADPLALAGLPEQFQFQYDKADTLIQRTSQTAGEPKREAMPADASGRNRPSEIEGKALAWDANGNLLSKGDLRFEYDAKNRLIRVARADGVEVARYAYDAMNRRIERTTGGQTYSTAWSDWQPIEERMNGELISRRTYGLRLDEVVRLETIDPSTGLTAEYVPVYDDTGHVAAVTGEQGKPIERYVTSPYGEVEIHVDVVPPAVEQVRTSGGKIWIELSEEILASELSKAGGLTIERVADGLTLASETTLPVLEGRLARRRLVVELDEAPEAGEEVRLRIPGEALVDPFLNKPSGSYELTFPWPAGNPAADVVLADLARPRVDQVLVREGVVEVQFTEEPDLAKATAAMLVDGEARTWTRANDRYALRATTSLSEGAHTVVVSTTGLDLADQGLEVAFEIGFQVANAVPVRAAYLAPNPRLTPSTTVGNHFGFQGLPKDPETGLVYVRNRYYDPELGRFITMDPLGYPDGPNPYAFAVGDPVNGSDPMGLCLGINNIPCTDTLKSLGGWTVGTGESLLQVAFAAPIMAYESTKNAVDATKRLVKAYDEGGLEEAYEVSQQIGREEQQRSKERLLGMIPFVNTYRQGSRIQQVCEEEGAFACGRQIGKTTVSVGSDAALVYGGVKAVQSRGASTTPGPAPIEVPGAPATTPLYRAVSPAELADLQSNAGSFRNPLGTEVKYFATEAEGAASYARQAHQRGGLLYEGPYTIVKSEFPTSAIKPEMIPPFGVDRGISTVVVPTEQLPLLAPGQPINFTPLPRPR